MFYLCNILKLVIISIKSENLSMDKSHKGLIFKKFSVIYITRSNYEIQEFSAFATYNI